MGSIIPPPPPVLLLITTTDRSRQGLTDVKISINVASTSSNRDGQITERHRRDTTCREKDEPDQQPERRKKGEMARWGHEEI